MNSANAHDDEQPSSSSETDASTRYRDKLKNHRRKTTLKLGTSPAMNRMRWRRLAKDAYQWKMVKQQ